MFNSDSILLRILFLIDVIPWPKPLKKRGKPYYYSPTVMVRCFIVRVWLRIPSNNALREYFSIDMPYNRRVMESCGLDRLPDRRTFDRRFKTISIDIRSRIDAMGILFIKDGLVGPLVSVDSSLLKAKGRVWNRSNMKKNEVPRSGIDTDAKWGFSRTKGWVFGYKLHIACSTGSLIVPLSVDLTTANISDNNMYESLTASLPEGVRYIVGDEGYDDHELCDFSRYRGHLLVFPLERHKHTTDNNRLALLQFYNSQYGQYVYSRRSISVEPLIEHMKDVFAIDPLPVRGFDKVRSIVLLSVLLYQVMVYYNHLVGRPLRALKHMLGS